MLRAGPSDRHPLTSQMPRSMTPARPQPMPRALPRIRTLILTVALTVTLPPLLHAQANLDVRIDTSGIYLCRLIAETPARTYTATGRMVLAR